MTGGGGRQGKRLIKRGLWVFGWDEKDFQMHESQDLRGGSGGPVPGWSEKHFSLVTLGLLTRDPKCPALATIAQ